MFIDRLSSGNERDKNVYSVEQVSSKENITVMFSFSAHGKTMLL
jgi:hypothetical protein